MILVKARYWLTNNRRLHWVCSKISHNDNTEDRSEERNQRHWLLHSCTVDPNNKHVQFLNQQIYHFAPNLYNTNIIIASSNQYIWLKYSNFWIILLTIYFRNLQSHQEGLPIIIFWEQFRSQWLRSQWHNGKQKQPCTTKRDLHCNSE